MNTKDRESPCDVVSQRCGHREGSSMSSERTDKDTEDEGPAEETFRDEDPATLPHLEWLEALYEKDSDGDLVVEADNGGKRIYAETARMFKLRRNLDQLDCFPRQKECDVLKAREELKLCCQNIEGLVEQRHTLEEEIEREKAADNSATVLRLQAQHKRLCQELQSEEDLEAHIKTSLTQHLLLSEAIQTVFGRLSSLRLEMEEEERVFPSLKAQKAPARLQQERKASQKLLLSMQQRRDKEAAMQEGEEIDSQKKLEDDQASHKKPAKYLKKTLKRMQQKEAEKEQLNRELLQKRMQAVMSLKSNIAAAQESLMVQQSRTKANTQKKEHQQRQLQQSLQAQGINSIKHMHYHNQLEELKKKKEELEERQKSKRVEIVAKILQEEQLVNRRKMLKPKATTDNAPYLGRASEKLQEYLDRSPLSATQEGGSSLREFHDTSSSSSATSDLEDLEETTYHEEEQQSLHDNLAEPEFLGLWKHNDKTTMDERTKFDVNLEVPLMATETLNLPVKNVCGKEQRGIPFISKPEVILYKDFEVGKTYKRKISVTNISYTTSCLKLLGVSDGLMDFVSINFEPPGSLCTGMSCDMQVVFQPMLNKDLEGEIQFASAMGPFSVPVRCTIKRCDMEVDSQFINFGSHVVGQTVSQTITLTNKGALATVFSLDTTCLSPETCHGQMTSQASASTQQVTTSPNTSSDNHRSSISRAAGELQPEEDRHELPVASQQEQSEVSVSGPEEVREAEGTSDMEALTDQSSSDSSDITIGKMRHGEIEPFQSVNLEIIFTPTIPGETTLDFHIKFSDLTCEHIPIRVRGVAVCIPVWVTEPCIDMKICMFDRLYQNTITVQSRANTALKLSFEVCPEMRNHMDIIPKTGFIQAKSSFNAQLRLHPRCSLSKDANEFFDGDTGVLEVPMIMQVADQVQPVLFTLHAVVTSSELHFDRTEVDFGECSIQQSVKTSIRLTNRSLLPQDFGFVGIPEFIEVQPQDGFGTLLPQETLELDVIFSPKKAKEYRCQLNCKSGINREFPISCRGVGVHPPLELSHSLVQFGATAVGDHSTTLLYLTHTRIDCNQSKQQLPQLSREDVAPGGPRLFSFTLPKDSEISISPMAGRLLPGERCLVQVTFRPRISDQEIKVLREQGLEGNRHPEQETKEEVPVEPGEGNQNSKNSNVSDSPETDILTASHSLADIRSEQLEEAKASLLYSFTQRCTKHTIPCFVSDGDPPEEDPLAQPAWSPSNTLYLKMECPAIQPSLVLAGANNGQNTINFHQVAVGRKVIKKFIVQNISNESLALGSSVLDINGTFSMLNALRCLRPGQKHTLLLAFSPTLGKKYSETLEVQCQKMTLEMTLHGEGVVPAVTSSHPDGPLDFGYVLEKESASKVLKLQNSSAVAVGFRVLLASVSPSRHQCGTDSLPFSLSAYTHPHVQPTVGIQNYSGLSVFTVTPIEGSISPQESQDITVTFRPDHPSVNYSDRLTVQLNNKSKVCEVDLKGAACTHSMYVCGGDKLSVPIESPLPPIVTSESQLTGASEMLEKPSLPVLLTLQAGFSHGIIRPAVRELQVGCIRSTQTSKKSGEFQWDNLASAQQQGFSVEPSKGSVEAGHTHTITITWTPYSGYKPSEVLQVCLPLTLKGEERNVYNVTLLALASSAD
ncbi:cilia- and flagella-associated protein 74 [Genypterus blacodes]|uniref:cilia- and flagella-associated protein 74 n=1 Tax=Genypterus blacodes TaxID=154954 RepID=UPI003F75B242